MENTYPFNREQKKNNSRVSRVLHGKFKCAVEFYMLVSYKKLAGSGETDKGVIQHDDSGDAISGEEDNLQLLILFDICVTTPYN